MQLLLSISYFQYIRRYKTNDMLTIKIKDKNLEKRITEKAHSFGKSTQEFVNELLINALPESKDDISFQPLSPVDHGYIINQIVEDVSTESSNIFSEVSNVADYVDALRKNAWRKK